MTSSWRHTLRNAVHQRNDHLRCWLSEFAGTFILVLMLDSMVASATFSRMMPNGDRRDGHDQVHVALGAALAVMMGVFAAAPSGAHLNPAVSVAFWLLGELTALKLVIYMLAQYLGAFLASATVYVVFRDTLDVYDGGNRSVTGPSATAGIWATYPSGDYLSFTTLFLDQVLSTFILMFILLCIVDAKGWNVPKGQVPMYVGLLIASIVFSLGYTTGAAMNPARDLMPRLFTLLAGWGSETFSVREYRWFLIPVLGSHLGAILGACVYQLFIGAHWSEDTAVLVKHRNLDVDMSEFRTPVTTRVSERFGGGSSNEKVPLHNNNAF